MPGSRKLCPAQKYPLKALILLSKPTLSTEMYAFTYYY